MHNYFFFQIVFCVENTDSTVFSQKVRNLSMLRALLIWTTGIRTTLWMKLLLHYKVQQTANKETDDWRAMVILTLTSQSKSCRLEWEMAFVWSISACLTSSYLTVTASATASRCSSGKFCNCCRIYNNSYIDHLHSLFIATLMDGW